MCCLRYEHETYEEALASLPKLDSYVETPDGRGNVCELVPLSGIVKVRFSGDHQMIKAYIKDDVKVLAPPRKEAKD